MANDNLISVDEFLSKRKGFVDDKGRLHKGLPATDEKGSAPSTFNADAGTVRFTMSAEIEDRDKDIVRQAGLDLKEFLKNPAAPFAHMSRGFPVGQWKDVEQKLTGRPPRTEGTLVLTAGDPDADRLKIHLAAGSIRACSIGFAPKTIQRRNVPEDADSYSWPGYEILEADLYECSPCMIPANPAALAKAAEAHGILPAEIISEILDTWKAVDGLILPRKAFEDELAKHAPGKTFSFAEKRFVVGENGVAVLAKEPAPERETSLTRRLAKLFGLGEDPAQDPPSIVEALKAAGVPSPAEPEKPEGPTAEEKAAAEAEEAQEIALLEAEHEVLRDRLNKQIAA